MTNLIKEYVNAFFKLQKRFDALNDLGNISIRFDNVEKKAQAKVTQDSKEFSEFVSVLNVFYKSNSRINIKAIIDFLDNNYSNKIDSTILKEIRNDINCNNKFKSLKPPKELSPKSFFEEALVVYCHSSNANFSDFHFKLIQKPVLGQLLWYEFYTFCINLFVISKNIFHTIKKYEIDSLQNSYSENGFCIICKKEIGPFNSVEHIFPESLGNTELFLEKGLVCDKCNNTVLSKLDEELIKFSPIAFLQVQFVPFTKEGKLPFANFRNIDIRKAKPNRLDIIIKDRSAKFKKEQIEGDLYRFNVTFTGGPTKDKMLIRSLTKIAYEALAREKGTEFVLQDKYENARNLIKGKIKPFNNLILSLKINPINQLKYSLNFGEPGTICLLTIFGLLFILNLESEPKLELVEEMEKDGFEIFKF